jgi:WD40 repeat protein/serine/threonine protein kinase
MKVCPRCHASHPDEFAFCPRDATPLVAAEPWSSGTLHGGYQILEALERDGPGERFRALHRESGERRVIRALEGWWLARASYAERFRQEIARAPLLDHPRAARVEGLFEPPGDRPYVVEEEVWGPSLREVLDTAALPVSSPWACFVARQIAGALEAAHALGLVHGAIRPRDVVFLDAVQPMELKVLGFGIGALRASEERTGLELFAARDGPPEIPAPLPSPYAAPERLPVPFGGDGSEVPDPRSDLYSLGVLLFEMLAGRLPPRPYQGPGPQPAESAAGRPVPVPLARLVGRLLEPASDHRPRSARELLAALAAAEEEMRRSAVAAADRRAEETGDVTAVLRSPRVKPAVPMPRTGLLLAARSLERQKSDMQAEGSYRAALLGDPENPFLHAFLGRALARQGRWGAAAASYRQALRLDPGLGPVHGRLHEALAALGDEAGARAVREAGHAVWWRLASPARRRIDGHGAAAIAAVAFSCDGACLASAGADGAVRLWNVRTGAAERVLTGHDGGVQALALAPVGRMVASAGRDGTVRLWDGISGRLLSVLAESTGGETAAVRAVAFSPDARWVASGGSDGAVRVWSAAEGRKRAVYRFRRPVNSVGFGPDGAILYGNVEGMLEIMDPARGTPRLTVRAHGEPVTAAAFSPDGGLVASGSVDGTVKLWEAATGEPAATLRGHTAAVSSVAFLPGGFLLASAGFDATVRLWDVFEGKLRDTFQADAGFLTSLTVSPDGGALAAGTDLGRIELWEEGWG